MAKFNLSPKVDEPRASKNIPDVTIPIESSFTGDIDTKAGIRIDGSIKGNVSARGNVTIGSYGHVEGCITGKDITIAGSITGDVKSFGTLQMTSGGKVDGDLQARSILIEEGAHFKGQCTITDNKADSAEDVKSSARLAPSPQTKKVTAESAKA
jgi:cytoskeletal protein CcmA (bactofilin family)